MAYCSDNISAGIEKLVKCYQSVLKALDYVEKLYNFKVSTVVEINYKTCVQILSDLPSYFE